MVNRTTILREIIMDLKSIKKFSIIINLIVIIGILYTYYKLQVTYKISKHNVTSIYCTYEDNGGYHKIKVNDSDRDVIISEISKMRQSGVEGATGTIRYKFTIDLANGSEFIFYQTSSETVALEMKKDKFFRNIEAPETAKFIERFITEHNLDIQ
jgi:hypothetical protein